MNIAICDNEEMFVKNISGLLEEYLNENKLQYTLQKKTIRNKKRLFTSKISIA